MSRRLRVPAAAGVVLRAPMSLAAAAPLVGPSPANQMFADEPPRVVAAGRDVITSVVATPLASPHPVLAADGRRHLVFELQAINAAGAPVTVDRITAIEPRTGRVLATLGAADLATRMAPFGGDPGGRWRRAAPGSA